MVMAGMGYAAYRLSQNEPRNNPNLNLKSKIVIKHGDEILDGPYPRKFTEFIGQPRARMQITAAILSAQQRNEVMGHMLLASGYPGIGKTALSRLTAHLLGVGFVELGGRIADIDAIQAVKAMEDGDVLFIDEIHRMVAGGKARAEWLLTLLQDGVIQTPTGVVQAPKVTVIGATTDAQKLPETILDRFTIKPTLETYTAAEAVQIATLTAKRLGYGGEHLPLPESTVWLARVALACDNNPRRMGSLLQTVRDVAIASRDEDGEPGNLTEEGYDLEIALDWSGLTADGLTSVMQDYLTALFVNDGKAGIGTLKASLNESELGHAEKALIQRGYVVVTPGGRMLTDYGAERAEQVARAQLAAAVQRESDSQKKVS